MSQTVQTEHSTVPEAEASSDLTRSEGAASRTAASPSPYHILAQGLNTGLLLNHILATARFSFPTKIF